MRIQSATRLPVPREGELLGWPHLPTHLILALILGASFLSWALAHTSPRWVSNTLLLWLLYLSVFWWSARLPSLFYRDLVQAGATIAVMMSLYLLLGQLAFAVIPWDGDRLVAGIDQWLGAGSSPVVFLGRLLASGSVEFWAVVYAFFIPYLYLSIFLCLLGRPDEERPLFISALAMTYAVSFVGYLLIPSRGPIVFLQHDFSSPLEGGYFLQLVVDSVARSGGDHGAFPSLHVGAAWFLCLFDLRRGQLRGMLYVPLVLGIAGATLVLRYHYLTDLIAGFLIATAAVLAAERIYRWPRPCPSIGANLWRRFLGCYFGGIQVRGGGRLPKETPILLLSNHSNAFIDPLILRVAFRRWIRLTAKAALLGNPLFAALMRLWGVIPLARPQDQSIADRRSHNQRAFDHCFQALDRGEILCLFPEGESHSEPSLKPLKSGAARLALDYRARSSRGWELLVVPVGLFYEAKERFGSRVLVEVGEPFSLAAWVEEHQTTEAGELTNEFDRRLRDLTLNFQDERSARLLPWVSELYLNHECDPAPLDQAWCLPGQFVSVTRDFIGGYHSLADRAEVRELEMRAEALRSRCEQSGIGMEELNLPMHPGKVLLFLVRELEMLFLGSLLFVLGSVLNLVPLVLTLLLVPLLSKDRDHWATNYLFLGTGLVGLWLVVASCLLAKVSLAAAACLPPISLFSGYFALRFLQRVRRALKRARSFLLFLLRPGLKEQLLGQSRAIAQEIERLAVEPATISETRGY